ncbi:uncharacterized protein ARMOST_20725 [Armillaria ostoyae]|uniref:Uncharacterized protein n=1 Tax=Armillaria ostoyae TaxID=47428 RepID=A0A284S887_ARMOS|nr:uncharacterized protein ARMOST_20725 [Armillaria ostoyae]
MTGLCNYCRSEGDQSSQEKSSWAQKGKPSSPSTLGGKTTAVPGAAEICKACLAALSGTFAAFPAAAVPAASALVALFISVHY